MESYVMKPHTHTHTHTHTHKHTHTQTHTVPHPVCLGGGVEGRSEEWGPLLALVPLLRKAPTTKGERWGGKGKVKDRMESKGNGSE